MLRNYLKIALRNLVRNKVYSFINIGGLAMGMAVALLIGLWIWDELSFDHYHQHHSRLAQVMDTQTLNGETSTSGAVAIPLADALRHTYPDDFKRVALVFPNFTHIVAAGDKKVSQDGMWAQPDLPEMLSLTMLKGDRDALKDPSSVLLTQSLAKALFGETDPMGKPIRLDNRTDLKVGGVFEDLPRNATFHDTKLFLAWDKAVSSLSWVQEAQNQWTTQHWQLFVQLNEQADRAQLDAKVKDIVKQHVRESRETIQLHPMDQWHLYSAFENGKVVGGRIQFVWLFGIIGAFVLLLACINFMNLSTARSEKRAREVGIRKAVGSVRSQLIGQFFSESLLVAGLALLVALMLVSASLPSFNNLADKAVTLPWHQPLFWAATVGFTLAAGLLSGSYPAFYLSGFQPVKVLKGPVRTGKFASVPRKVLVVVQFTISITLIIGTIIVYRQVQYAKNRPVGYSREGLISIRMNTPELYGARYDALRRDLLQTGTVADMTESSSPSTETPAGNQQLDWKGKEPNSATLIQTVGVTHDYGKTLNWKVLAGRDFSRGFATDSGSLILNEAAARLTGFKNPVGETIRWDGKSHQIIGVVKDLVMESPYKPIHPCLFVLDYSWANFITIRLKTSLPTHEALAKVASVFKTYNPASPFDYKFTDEDYARKFSDEERIGHLATVFAVLAIFISCLGLFGLAAYVAEQRTKEIGIRKVLGASVLNLWGLLSKDFVFLVAIAFCIATPTAWYLMSQWLQKYDYRTEVSVWIFALSGVGTLLVTLLTVSFQSIRAALLNPIRSLRSE